MLNKTIRLTQGETVKVSNQWAAEAEKRGTSVSASEWETTSGSLSGEALSSNLATVLLASDGSGYITNTVTFANGEVAVSERRVTVESSNS